MISYYIPTWYLHLVILQDETKSELKNIFKDAGKNEKKKSSENENGKRKKTALEEIMEEEKKRKKLSKVFNGALMLKYKNDMNFNLII